MNDLGTELQGRPNLDLGPAFFTVAVKEGSSELFHQDWMDNNKYDLTWITVTGSFEGAEFVLPQLNRRIPLRPGQLLGVLTSWLLHSGLEVKSGRQITFTMFGDSLPMRRE
jgi:hypothetical protein